MLGRSMKYATPVQNRRLPSVARALVTLTSLLAGVGCVAGGGGVEGQVFEDGADRPAAGALVTIRWMTRVSSLVDSQSVCVHSDTAATDAQGRYRFENWFKRSKVGPVFSAVPYVEAYKAGYVSVPLEARDGLRLSRFTGSAQERLAYLQHAEFRARACAEPAVSGRNLLPLYRALHAEAQALASTPADRRTVEGLLMGLEDIEFGYEESVRRAGERTQERESRQ